MRPFQYVRADNAVAAVAMVSADPEAQYLAGGTTQLDIPTLAALDPQLGDGPATGIAFATRLIGVS